jgi:fucose permease
MREASLQADPSARNAALGFLLAGILMGATGSLTVAWRYQLDRDPRIIGLHFLAFNAAVLLCGFLSQAVLRRISIKAVCAVSCAMGCLGFLELTMAAPPVATAWRITGVALLGAGAGGLLTALLHFVRPYYLGHAASAINFCSLMFGLGCLLVTLTVGGTYLLLQIRWETLLLAVIFVAFSLRLATESPMGREPAEERKRVVRRFWRELRSPAVILFSLLLFFQFGNEWALASWLPLFLIHRLGLSPQSALFVLALYFLALITGRVLSQLVLAYVGHAKLLFGSTFAAMLGYLLLSFTQSGIGAGLATVLTGLAFAPVYALVAEKIGHRFDYEPGFFNGIFSLAVTGGMLIPWVLGFVGYYLGMEYVLLIPGLGSAAVLVLVLLIMLEAKLMRGEPETAVPTSVDSSKAIAAGAGKRS